MQFAQDIGGTIELAPLPTVVLNSELDKDESDWACLIEMVSQPSHSMVIIAVA
jgi:hypothetical protein